VLLTSSGCAILFLEFLMTINEKRSGAYARVLRMILVLFGAIAAGSGFYGYFHGNVSYTQYNARVGAVENGNALWFGILGVIMMVIGLIRPRKSAR
jgi:hypothetical protein